MLAVHPSRRAKRRAPQDDGESATTFGREPSPASKIIFSQPGELTWPKNTQRHPRPMSNEDLAAAANYAAGAGSFNNPRGRLKSLGLVEYLGGGQVKASDCLFPSAR